MPAKRSSIHFNIGMLVITGYIFFTPVIAQKTHCKFSVAPSVSLVNGHTNGSMVRPGDTICLQAGQKSFLLLSYLHGTKNSPIVIINSEGQVLITNSPNYGIKFDSCSYIKLSGKGSANPEFGIKVEVVPGSGLSVDGLSTNIEIEGVEIGYTGFSGLVAKTDPDCSFTSTRDKFILRDLKIHDNFIHHTNNEGLYIGSSKYKNGQTLNCNGRDTILFPHLLKGVRVYNNRLEFTGWDGIQVSSADSACFIHDNLVLFDSEGEQEYQMSGIIIGGGTNAECYNNIIKDGKGDGIEIVSLGLQKVYNNLIVNPGRTYKINQNYTPYLKHGIYVGPDYQSPSNSYLLVNNTIISPKSFGIKFVDAISTNNLIANTIIINPGSYPMIGEDAYINLISSAIDIKILNNIKNRDFATIDFVDPGEDNFDLKASSPAVNKGLLIDGFLLNFDILSRLRPFASVFDIGAYECQDSSLLDIDEFRGADLIIGNLFPNPFNEKTYLNYSLRKQSFTEIGIFNPQGEKVMEIFHSVQPAGKYNFTIEKGYLRAGLYILSLKTGDVTLIIKLILLN
ncbi:MAG: T9SS type A sorting domain-containing protein [Bacteroidota bacterium]